MQSAGPGNEVPIPQAERLAALALAAIRREYPSHVGHLMESDADARPPRELTPIFYGSFDWHSAVHGHWTLVRLLRRVPAMAVSIEARAALATSFTDERVAGELAYLGRRSRRGFERPYGLAWLLQLCAELREWDDPSAIAWRGRLAPLESLAAERLNEWLAALPAPVRSGQHPQSAFALCLMHDWARVAGDLSTSERVRVRAAEFHAGEVDAPVAYEPSGHDFLSPILAECDLMRRVLTRDEFHSWLSRFLPALDRPEVDRWLRPVVSPDRSDGKLAHLDGLNLSRAWMLEGIAAALSPGSPGRERFIAAAALHREAGLAALATEHYAGSHWLASFATYLVTRRGLDRPPAA